jgi:hypothetical protein
LTAAPEPGPAGGPIAVRPPALVEAAEGVRAAVRVVDESAVSLAESLTAVAVFGSAQGSFAGMGRAWLDELRLLVHQVGALSASVEAAAADYLRTDAAAAAAAR